MTFVEARDAMLGIFNAAWAPTGFQVVWSDLPADDLTGEACWARITLKHALGGQGSLSGEAGTRYDRAGTLFVQIFAPAGDGNTKGYELAQLVVNAYQAAKGGAVWYRNTRMREAGNSGPYSQINVLVDFSYDDVR